MRVTRIQTKEFLAYRNLDIEVVESDKGIALFQGINGRGKSSLFTGIKWCLYGVAVKDSATLKGKQLLNRKYVAEHGSTRDAEVSVTLHLDFKGDKYELTRSLQFGESDTPKETVSIKKNGDVRASKEFEDLVQEFLPERIKDFFVYDGESQKLFERMADGEREDVQNAIQNLLGVPVIRLAVETIKSRVLTEIKAQRGVEANANKRTSLQNKIAEYQLAIEEHDKNIEKFRIARNEAEQEAEYLEEQNKSYDAFRKLLEEERAAKTEVDRLSLEINSLQQKLVELQADSFWLPCFKALTNLKSTALASQEAHSIFQRQVSAILGKISDVKRMKTSDECPLCKKNHGISDEDLESKISKLQESLSDLEDSAPVDMASTLLHLDTLAFQADRESRVEGLLADLNDRRASHRAAITRYRLAKGSRTGFSGSEASAQEIMDKYNRARRDASVNRDRHRDETQLKKTVQAQLDDAVKQFHELNPNVQTSNSLALLQIMKQSFEFGESIYVGLVRERVEEYASPAFVQLSAEPEKFAGIQVRDDFTLVPILKNNARDEGLNHGHRKGLAIALVQAMLKVAMVEPFIFMDSPESSLDELRQDALFAWAGESGMPLALFVIPRKNGSAWVVPREHISSIGENLERHYDIRRVDADESEIVVFSDGVDNE